MLRSPFRSRARSGPAASIARRAFLESTAAALVVAAIVLVSIIGLWRTSERTILHQMHQDLRTLAGIAASTIDPELHQALRSPEQIDSPLYEAAIRGLRRAQAMTPDVKYMYTMVQDGPHIRFVLDTALPGDHDGDGREDRAQVWEIYDSLEPELLMAFGGPGGPGMATSSRRPHTDEWGTFMTGYAPILDADGHQIGVAGVDLNVDTFYANLREQRRQVMLGLIPAAFLTLAVGIGAFILRCRHQMALRAAEEGERRAMATAGRLAESERRFRTLADGAPMLVWSARADGYCDFVNKPWCDFVGARTEDEVGGGWLTHIHDDDVARVREEFFAAVREQRQFLSEYRIRRADGEWRLIIDKGVPREETGVFVGLIGAGLDITELRFAQEEMKRAVEAAQAADQAKSDFLANMSHEIRTPITTILGYTDLIRSSEDLRQEGLTVDDALRSIRSASEHLLTVINDVLDFSKIEAGFMRVERIETDLPALLTSCLDLVRLKAREKGLALELRYDSPIPTRVMIDPTRLRQVVLNLLSNAVKFTRVGEVRMKCRYSGELLSIEIEDTGVGLAPAQANKLFKPFSQADSSVTRTHGGTGLGLAICRRLAELMGGTVLLVRSEPGVGSTFGVRVAAPMSSTATLTTAPAAFESVTLPVGIQAPRGSTGESGHRIAPTSPVGSALPGASSARRTLRGRILLVEDSADNRRLIAHYLARAGAEVVLAEHGGVALDRLKSAEESGAPIDLVVTDLQMPTMDGLTLMRTIRNSGSTIPIVALTAHAVGKERDRCLVAGCSDFTTKPIDRDALLSICARWLEAKTTAPNAATASSPEAPLC
ncbi:MAG: response regulator [Phycisphaeraceae bacterium]|nr:response regulator [Phycisphaeraceae bacterium]